MHALNKCLAMAVLLMLGLSAHAQVKPTTTPSTPADSSPLTLPSFTAAYDTLLARTGRVRTQARVRQGIFNARFGSLSGLHRRIKSYVPVGADGGQRPGILVQHQVIKHSFGIELQKITYYDVAGRKVLRERYEGHQLVKLEMLEYASSSSTPAASWLFVRGDYLRYSAPASSPAGKRTMRRNYFFNPQPAGT
jgi:hypothetical protein